MKRQKLKQASDLTPIFELIDIWLNDPTNKEANSWHTFSELYPLLQEVAKSNSIDFWWKGANTLAMHMTGSAVASKLEKAYGAIFTEALDHHIHKVVWKIQFPPF
jgi:hypothetical protein